MQLIHLKCIRYQHVAKCKKNYTIFTYFDIGFPPGYCLYKEYTGSLGTTGDIITGRSSELTVVFIIDEAMSALAAGYNLYAVMDDSIRGNKMKK